MVGERLKETRKLAGLSQKDLAERLSVTYHTISSYERNRSEPNDDIKVKIAKILNVSLDYLLGLIREPFHLTRDDNSIVLPSDFSKEARDDVLRYVEFIKDKYPK